MIKNTIALNPGSTSRAPCLNFCEQVITRCINRYNLDSLDGKWRAYVTALGDIAAKLSNNYNIESIIAPLDVQISEAIMNFQENAQNISHHVFQNCGQAKILGADPSHLVGNYRPQVSNRLGKRAAPPMEGMNRNPVVMNGPIQIGNFQHSPYGFFGSRSNNNNNARYSSNSQQIFRTFPNTHSIGNNAKLREGSSHNIPYGIDPLPEDFPLITKKPSTLIEEIRSYMLSTRSFWSSLPNAVCTSNQTLGSNATGSLRKQFSNNCFSENFGSLDMNTDLRYKMAIHQLVNKLESMRSKLELALAGNEIDWLTEVSKQDVQVPNFPNNNIRLPPIHMTTTTTTTMSPDADESELPEEEDSEPDFDDSGSGFSQPDDQTDEPELDELDEPQPDETTDEMQTSTPTTTISQPEEPTNENSAENPVSINQLTILDDPSSNLITPPDAQKSSQSSTKLVINNAHQLLLLISLLFCCLLHLTNRRQFWN